MNYNDCKIDAGLKRGGKCNIVKLMHSLFYSITQSVGF